MSKKSQVPESPKDVNAVLESLPKEKREVIEGILVAMEQKAFTGPIPAPEDFAGYENVLPGAADRILGMSEDNSRHRKEMEKAIVEKDYKLKLLGYIIGAILIAMFGIFALLLGMNGHDELAGKIGVTTVVCVAIVFVLNKLPFMNKSEEQDD